MAKLTKIEGVGEFYAQKLQEAGIATTQALLEKGASPQGRKEIAEKAGIPETFVLRWVNHVDLFRIKGVGEEYADLLEASGVDTVPELAQRNPENLYPRLVAVNREKKLVRQLPTQAQVGNWVEQAKRLPRVVTY
jgi:predicted flap endonuclease-1-like 5' DNA nuclease